MTSKSTRLSSFGTPDPAFVTDGPYRWQFPPNAGADEFSVDGDDTTVAIILANALGDSDFESSASPESISTLCDIFAAVDCGIRGYERYDGSAGGRHGWLTCGLAECDAPAADDIEFDADTAVVPPAD